MITYILSQGAVRPWPTLGAIAGVALGAALFVALVALGNGFQEAVRAPLANVAADLLITRQLIGESAPNNTRGLGLPFGSTPLTGDDLTNIEKTTGITAYAGGLEVWDFGTTQYQTILGLDAAQDQVGPIHALQEGLVAGRLFKPDELGIAVADRHYAAFFSLKPGDAVTIGEESFELVGVAEQQGSSQAGVANLYIPLADAQALAGLEASQVNQVYARVADASQVESIVAELTAQDVPNAANGQLSIISQESILQVMGGVARISARFAGVAALVGMMGGWLLTWVAMAGLFSERRHEIGIMRAVGWHTRYITNLFLLESFLLSLIGGVAGIALGLIAAQMMTSLPAPTINLAQSLPGLAAVAPQEVHLASQVTLQTLALALFVALSGGLLQGFLSARRAAALKPSQII